MKIAGFYHPLMTFFSRTYSLLQIKRSTGDNELPFTRITPSRTFGPSLAHAYYLDYPETP